MRAIMVKTIFTTGDCSLTIRSPHHHADNAAGHCLLPDGQTLKESDITNTLLQLISEAYEAGYSAATQDCDD